MKKQQLVIQFDLESSDYDSLISAENLLDEHIGNSDEVDGNDIGSGEFNIFILTDDSIRAFEKVKKLLAHMLPLMRAGYRDVLSDSYIPLWPPGLRGFTVS